MLYLCYPNAACLCCSPGKCCKSTNNRLSGLLTFALERVLLHGTAFGGSATRSRTWLSTTRRAFSLPFGSRLYCVNRSVLFSPDTVLRCPNSGELQGTNTLASRLPAQKSRQRSHKNVYKRTLMNCANGLSTACEKSTLLTGRNPVSGH